jgi:hypothetical protein
MGDQKNRVLPDALEPPIQLSSDQSQYVFWEGDTVLRQDTRSQLGKAKIIFFMHPTPEFRFEFVPHKTPDFFEAWSESGLSDATFDCGDPFGEVVCKVTNSGREISGYLDSQTQQSSKSLTALKAVFIVINGPHVYGEPLNRGKCSYLGRLESTVDDHKIVIDALQSDQTPRGVVYEQTHVASCEFVEPANFESIEQVGSHLFRVLSLMKCRWVGLLGPWIYDSSGKLIETRLSVTKTMRNGGAISWYHKMMHSSFNDFYKSMYYSFQDKTRGPALQTASHWLVESEQCAGGVEGAIILQQSALECLAWLEIVLVRKLCSESGFKSLPASDKIRWLLSLNKISCDIPQKSAAISAYAKAFNLANLVEVLADVRNALVHAEPKKAERLFSRTNGDEERGDLWYQTGGILQQAFLASIGYTGKMLRRDVDCEYATQATKLVPWTGSLNIKEGNE